MKIFIFLFFVVLAFGCNKELTVCDCACDKVIREANQEKCRDLLCEEWGYGKGDCSKDHSKLEIMANMSKTMKGCDCLP